MTSKEYKLTELLLAELNVNETLSQLRAGGINILWSWAARGWTNVMNKGLLFRVSGFKHKGYVLITLDYSDTYTIHLLNMKYNVKKTLKNVYCDELTERIDEVVEKVGNYNKRVKKEYDWN